MMMPQDIILICGAVIWVFGGAAGLVSLGRHRGLADRVNVLEDDIKRSLARIEYDGRNSRELLLTVVRGHMGEKS
nr:hypothetical protein [uncultured Acetobacter sp.]